MIKLLCYIIFSLNSSDSQSLVKFPVSYPLEANILVSEKSKVLYESPLSEYLSGDFNVIAVHGKVSDVNVYFEIWIPQIQENEEETAYNIIKPSTYKIYRNGRFWVRFDLASKVNRFKLVVINNGVIDEEFRVSIYEVQLAKIVKKKQEAFLLINDSLFLNDPLPFKLIRRSQWQAKDPTSSYISHTPKKITIHHTAGNYVTTYEDSLIEIQLIQEYHQQGRGWIDIGYHFLIDPLGNIFEGRPILAVGAHVSKNNIDNIGISIMGNYHHPVNNEITDASLSSLINLVKYIKDKYNIKKNFFYAHRELTPTDCPGDNIYLKMPYLREEIFNKVGEDSVSIEVNFGNSELNKKIIEAVSSW